VRGARQSRASASASTAACAATSPRDCRKPKKEVVMAATADVEVEAMLL